MYHDCFESIPQAHVSRFYDVLFCLDLHCLKIDGLRGIKPAQAVVFLITTPVAKIGVNRFLSIAGGSNEARKKGSSRSQYVGESN